MNNIIIKLLLIGLIASSVIMASCTKNDDETDTIPTQNTFTDIRDGKTYKYIKIGNQIWMAENLNYNPSTTSGSWIYGNCFSNAIIFGRLYNWKTACTFCPEGWHLPSKNEWQELINYLGGDSIAGGKLKQAGFELWAAPNEGATNSSKFTALPGSWRESDGTFNNSLGMIAIFWSSTQHDFSTNISAYRCFMQSSNSVANLGSFIKDAGNSVRCVRD